MRACAYKSCVSVCTGMYKRLVYVNYIMNKKSPKKQSFYYKSFICKIPFQGQVHFQGQILVQGYFQGQIQGHLQGQGQSLGQAQGHSRGQGQCLCVGLHVC